MELTLTILIILLIVGLIVGIIGTISGIGGGVFYVTILTLIFFMPINEAIDTSNYIILITSGVGFFTYLKQGRTNLKLSLIFSGFSILGSLICAIIFLFVHIENTLLKFIFASVLLITGVYMAIKAITTYKKNKDPNINRDNDIFSLKNHDYKKNLKKGIPLFMAAGFVSYLLGIGGGVINTPTLNIVLGYPIHNSTAISTSIIFFTAIFNVIIKAIYGKIHYLIGTVIGIGSVLGAYIGAKVSRKMPKTTLQVFVAVVIIGLSIRMFF